MSTEIKICGFQDSATAQAAVLAGVQYIGLIFHPASRRYIAPSKAKKIVQDIRDYGATAVGIFVDQNAEEIMEICHATDIGAVQLHGLKSRQAYKKLPSILQRFYTVEVSPHGEVSEDHMKELTFFDEKRDYVLFDGTQSGSGIRFDWNRFSYEGPFRMGIAGGLNVDNVNLAIQLFKPALVDVSSGVENNRGVKDIRLIKKFVTEVRKLYE